MAKVKPNGDLELTRGNSADLTVKPTLEANPTGKNAYFTASASFNNGILHM